MAKGEANADDGPDSVEAVQQAEARRKRRLLVGASVVVVALVAGTVAVLVEGQRAAKAALTDSAADLSQCLFGEAVPASERPSGRLRNVLLASMGMSKAERANERGEMFPERCALSAQALLEAAKSNGLGKPGDDASLGGRADSFAAVLKTAGARFADLSAPVDDVWEALGAAGVEVVASPRVEGPPAIAAPLAELPEAARLAAKPFPFSSIQTSTYAGDVAHMLVQDPVTPEAPFVCGFGKSGVDCHTIGGELGRQKARVSFVGSSTSPRAALLLAGDEGARRLHRSDTGALVSEEKVIDASIDEQHRVTLLVERERKFERLVIEPGGGEPKRTRLGLPPDCAAYAVGLLYARPYVLCGREAGGVALAHLVEGPGDDDPRGKEAGPVPTLGGRACRAGETSLITVRREVAFEEATGFASTALSPMGAAGALTCGERSASFTRLTDARRDQPWRARVLQARCTVAKCEEHGIGFEEILRGGLEGAPRGDLFDAASIGSKAVVAWASGERGGIRVRIGSPDELGRAQDVVVFDDTIREGSERGQPAVTALAVVGQPTHATLLLRTDDGLYAVTVDAERNVTPTEVHWAKHE